MAGYHLLNHSNLADPAREIYEYQARDRRMSDQSGWLYLCPARLHFFLLLRCTCGLVMLKSAKSVAVMSRSPKARKGSGLYGFHLELKSIGTVQGGSTSFIDFQNSNCTNKPISSSFGRFITELLMVFSSNDTVTFFSHSPRSIHSLRVLLISKRT